MLKCKQCGEDLGHYCQYGYRVFDLGLKKVGLFCEEHGRLVEENLKAKRFVEEYKGNKIYMKDGNYYPYWECPYYFDNLDDVRTRIDNSQVPYADLGVFKFING